MKEKTNLFVRCLNHAFGNLLQKERSVSPIFSDGLVFCQTLSKKSPFLASKLGGGKKFIRAWAFIRHFKITNISSLRVIKFSESL